MCLCHSLDFPLVTGPVGADLQVSVRICEYLVVWPSADAYASLPVTAGLILAYRVSILRAWQNLTISPDELSVESVNSG